MASCSFNFSALPTIGIFRRNVRILNKENKTFFAGTSRELPPGLLLLGGQSTPLRPLSSVETFGLENCTIPSLPETRYGFGSFITPTEPPQLAVCGGWWMGKPDSSDCLTLNVTSGRWERGAFTDELEEDGVRGMINIEGEGIFAIHSTGILFHARGSKTWEAGPVFPASAVSSCKVSSTSFVTIHMNGTHNVREHSVSNGQAELEPIDSWPNLLTKRHGPGCAATSYNLIVAGGVSDWDEVLTSVEVFNIESKALRRGRNLQQARAYFQIIPVGTTYLRLLVVGGQGVSSALDTSEWWEEEEDSWEEGPELSRGRSNFGALMAPPHIVCSEIDPPPHSCPSALNTGQPCVFPTGNPGACLDRYIFQGSLAFHCC